MAAAYVPQDRAAGDRGFRAQRSEQLVGRGEDRGALDELLQQVRGGVSASLVLVGEPGIGKTRLLDYLGESVADVQAVRTAGHEAEARLGFAALHRLLAPLLGWVDALPAPQRAALRSTFGLTDGPPPDSFLVGLATLTLLADAAAREPLLCLVDDAQWVDRESLVVLGFVARRLRMDGMGVVFAVRDGEDVPPALEGLPSRALRGLSYPDARELLASRVAGRLDEQVAARIVDETGGNPLALIELAAELTADQLAGRASLPMAMPVGQRLEVLFLRRVEALPAETRSLLLVASAAPPRDPAVLWRAGALLGVGPLAADPAVLRGIVSLDPAVDFRHPLIRSAVYTSAPADQRRQVHEALAAALHDEQDRDRRAWHLATATVQPDEGVAAELERCAERARSRGGYSAQAAFLLRAAELSPAEADRSGRLLASAHAHLLAGDAVAAQARLDQAASGLTEPLVRAQGQRLRAAIEQYFARLPAVPSILLQASADVAPLDVALSRELVLDALQAAILSRRHTTGTTLAEVARAVRATPRPAAYMPAVRDLLLDAFAARIAEGYAAAVPLLREAVAALEGGDEIVETGVPLAVLGALAADELWDEPGCRNALQRLDRFDRDQGALGALHITVLALAGSELRAGRLAAAEALHEEAAELAEAIGFPSKHVTVRVELLAWQGREAEARAAAEIALRVWDEQLGIEASAHIAYLGLIPLELSLGRYPEALDWALRLFDGDPPGFANRALVDVVEAGVRAGDRAAAAAALTRLEERAPVAGTAWALGQLARGRALMADGDEAEPFYLESIELLRGTPVVIDLARSQLLYGEWLRRHRRRVDARRQLRVAYDAFASMGAIGFAERALSEMLVTGERAQSRTPQASLALSPQETRIARFVTEGATNAEIATRLFITASTVEYHLSKIFRKLDITSRRQLARALREHPAGSLESPD